LIRRFEKREKIEVWIRGAKYVFLNGAEKLNMDKNNSRSFGIVVKCKAIGDLA